MPTSCLSIKITQKTASDLCASVTVNPEPLAVSFIQGHFAANNGLRAGWDTFPVHCVGKTVITSRAFLFSRCGRKLTSQNQGSGPTRGNTSLLLSHVKDWLILILLYYPETKSS